MEKEEEKGILARREEDIADGRRVGAVLLCRNGGQEARETQGR